MEKKEIGEKKEKEEKKVKASFTSEDTEHLIEIIKKVTKNNIAGQISKEDWTKITSDYNAGQTGGIKTTKELWTKFKNLKAKTKKTLSENAREIKKTGGGTAKIVKTDDEELFGFKDSQIIGLNNPVDDDTPPVNSDDFKPFLSSPDNLSKAVESNKSLKQGQKRKINDEAELYSLKKRNLQLQNLYLERKIQKIDMEMASSSSSSNSKKFRIDSDTSDDTSDD